MDPSDQTAADRYRIEVTRGSIFAGLIAGRKRSKRVGAVAIVDGAGTQVWRRPIADPKDAAPLVRLIESQVLTARLADFERWLREQDQTAP